MTSQGEHLLANRPLILGRSLLAGLGGLIPLPGVDDAVVRMLRRGLLSRLAERRHIDIDEAALDALSADSPAEKPSGIWSLLGGAIPVLHPRSWTRRLLVGFLLARRLDEVVRVFHLGTLFDHYCARQHVGIGLDLAAAVELRRTIEQVARQVQRESATAAFTGALMALGSALAALPGWLYHVVRPGVAMPVPMAMTVGVPVPMTGGAQIPGAAETAGAVPKVALLRQVLPLLKEQTRRLLRNDALNRYGGRLARAFDLRWARPDRATAS